MDTILYNQSGERVGSISLPENVFGVKWNADLVHQAVVTEAANSRDTIAHAKNRAEVRGGGKKPWKQKGTGRARHGSSRSPIWRHGGKAHGPNRLTDFSKTMNKKMRNKALFSVLSAKERDGEIIFLDKVALKEAKTKTASSILSALATKLGKKELGYAKGNRAIIALSGRDAKIERSFRNIPTVLVDEVRNLTAKEALDFKHILFVGGEEAVDVLAKRAGVVKEKVAKVIKK